MKNLYNRFLESSGICTDTRRITNDCLFIALKGENFDGNDYVEKALDKGAKYAVTDRDNASNREAKNIIVVEDSLKCLQDLANYHRNNLSIPIIGITGSNGKTTTKELLHKSLSTSLKTFSTPGNFNNHIGLPLSLLQISKEHQIAVLELGDNHRGEIAELCEIAEPSHCFLTNIGKDHIEGFGSYENNVLAKKELFDYAESAGVPSFIDSKEKEVFELASALSNKILFPTSNGLTFGQDEAFVTISYRGKDYKTNLVGAYNSKNITAAFHIAVHFGAEQHSVLSAIAEYQPQNNRSQLIETKENLIYLDAYNANPSSMELALESFNKFELKKNKVLILGDMLELGELSKEEHEHIVDLAQKSLVDKIYLVGNEFAKCSNLEGTLCFSDSSSLLEHIKKEPLRDCQILLKGSRGIRLEKVLDVL